MPARGTNLRGASPAPAACTAACIPRPRQTRRTHLNSRAQPLADVRVLLPRSLQEQLCKRQKEREAKQAKQQGGAQPAAPAADSRQRQREQQRRREEEEKAEEKHAATQRRKKAPLLRKALPGLQARAAKVRGLGGANSGGESARAARGEPRWRRRAGKASGAAAAGGVAGTAALIAGIGCFLFLSTRRSLACTECRTKCWAALGCPSICRLPAHAGRLRACRSACRLTGLLAPHGMPANHSNPPARSLACLPACLPADQRVLAGPPCGSHRDRRRCRQQRGWRRRRGAATGGAGDPAAAVSAQRGGVARADGAAGGGSRAAGAGAGGPGRRARRPPAELPSACCSGGKGGAAARGPSKQSSARRGRGGCDRRRRAPLPAAATPVLPEQRVCSRAGAGLRGQGACCGWREEDCKDNLRLPVCPGQSSSCHHLHFITLCPRDVQHARSLPLCPSCCRPPTS